MYRLTIVAGPNRGTSYVLHDGETTVGRLAGSSIVLNSGKVSKRHCKFVITNGEVIVKDEGSSNGTFANGVIVRTPRPIVPGDRVSIGEFVVELAMISNEVVRNPQALPSQYAGESARPVASAPMADPGFQQAPVSSSMQLQPQDLRGRLLWAFEMRLMPYFYKLMLTYEWRTLLAGAFGVFVVLAVLLVVEPAVTSSDEQVIREVQQRARVLARVVVESNQGSIQQRLLGQTAIPEAIARARGVRQAILVDMDGRTLAPAEKVSTYQTTGTIAASIMNAKKQFMEQGQLKSYVKVRGSESVVVVEPMVLYSPKDGKNVPVAMGVVEVDSSMAVQSMGDVAVALSNALIWLSVMGGVIAIILYRITLKPLQILHDEMDRALKGEGAAVTREVKFSELGQLLDVVETAIQRATKGGSSDGSSGLAGVGAAASVADEVGAYKMLGDASSFAVAVCDAERRPVYLNGPFENVTGIRHEFGESQPLSGLARDQAFGSLLSDLFDRTPSSPDGLGEDFDFSGVPFHVRMVALNGSGGQPRGFVLTARRQEEG